MALRIALFYAAVFLFVGISLPYWPVWLRAKGLGPAEIGLLISVGTWVRIGFPLLVAHFADRRGERKRVIVLLAVAALLVNLLFLVADGLAPLLAVSVLAALAFTPIMPLTENLSLLLAREGHFEYGRVRLWGSLAFIAAAMGTGKVVGVLGEATVLWLVLATLLVVAAVSAALPDRRPEGSQRRLPVAALLADRTMLVFLVAAALIQSSHAAYYGFSTIAWRKAGVDDGVIGLLWGEGVLAEVVLFAFAGRLAARLGPVRLLMIAAVAGIVRWTTFAFETDVAALAIVQALHAFTFGAAHLGAMLFLSREVPPERSASAQTLYSAVAMGLVMGGATIVAGALFEARPADAFLAMVGLSVAGGLAALALGRRLRPRRSPA